jgi:hypothetical protein
LHSVQVLPLPIAPAPQGLLAPRLLDQYPPYRFGRGSKEVAAGGKGRG